MRRPTAMILALALAACTGGPPGAVKPSPRRTGAPAVTPSPGGVTPNLVDAGIGGIISNNGAAARTSATHLAGLVTAPPGLLSNNGAGIVANNGGGLVTDNGAGMVGNGSSNVVANNGAGYRLHAAPAQVPAAGVKVRLVDAAGRPVVVEGAELVATTGADGRYAFARALPAQALVAVVDLGAKGLLRAVAPKDRAARSTADVDLVSSLTTGYILDRFVATQADPVAALDRLTGEAERRTRDVAAGSLPDAPIERLTAADAVKALDDLRAKAPAVADQLEVVRKLLTIGGSASLTDGPALAAALNAPRGLAVDAAGNVYLADTTNNLIRRLDPAGRVATIAGNGSGSNLDGPGAAASIYAPYGLAVGPGPRLYVSCKGAVIRQIDLADPAFPVTTIAGSRPGRADGPGAVARFSNPLGLAVDARDAARPWLLVADTGNHQVRRIDLADPAHAVTTVAGTGRGGRGDGPGAAATFYKLQCVAVGPDGAIWVGDTGNHLVRRIAPDGTVSTAAGDGSAGRVDGPAAAARFDRPTGVAVDAAGRVVVTDTGNHAVRRLDPAAKTVETWAGTGAVGPAKDGPGATATFHDPQAVAIGADGATWIADMWNHVVRRIGADGAVTTAAGTGASASADGSADTALFNKPRGLAVDEDGTIWLADTFNHKIRRVDPDGTVTTVAGGATSGTADGAGGPDGHARFWNPYGVVIDRRDRARPALLVADSFNHTIRRIDLAAPGYAVTTVAGRAPEPAGAGSFADGPGADARFDRPTYLALAPDGRLYVSEATSRRVRLVDLRVPAHPVSTVAGTGVEGALDGPGATATFRGLNGIALDGEALYVADTYNHKIRKIDLADAAHPVTTVAGSGAAGLGDGPAATATFERPQALAIDRAAGGARLFVADTFNNAIRRIDLEAAGRPVITFAGTGLPGFEVGDGPLAAFSEPAGVAVDPAGNVYVADTGNNRIRNLGLGR